MTDTTTDADELSRIEAKITALAESALTTGRPYLLSELGLALGDDLRVLKKIGGYRLVEFIRDRLTPRFQLVRLGVHANVYALTLAPETSVDATIVAEEEVKTADGTNVANKTERYHYRFWAAFAVPLKSDVRHLDRRAFTFTDTTNDAPLPEGALLIPAGLIPPSDMDNRDKAINENIKTWLTENQLSASEFLASSKPLPRVMTVTSQTSGASLLEHMLDCLDRHQLQNTALTLDVVGALLRKRI